MVDFWKRVREQLKLAGISDNDFAMLSGVRISYYIGYWDREISRDDAAHIANTLHVSLEYLVTGKEIKWGGANDDTKKTPGKSPKERRFDSLWASLPSMEEEDN
jgi:transcriptional regulator with XRE-family HTH domain